MKQLELTFIFVRQIGTNEWLEFKDKKAAGKFYSSIFGVSEDCSRQNIGKLVNGSIKSYKNYEAKEIKKIVDVSDKEFWRKTWGRKNRERISINNKHNRNKKDITYDKKWSDICDENNLAGYNGKPYMKRDHTIMKGIIGKICCKCEKWTPLTNYYNINGKNPTWDKKKCTCKTCEKKYNLLRSKNEPAYRIRKNLSERMRKVTQNAGSSKCDGSITLLGCTANDLKIWIENKFKPEMTWKNYGRRDSIKTWEIDHIIPCAAFDLNDELEQKACFHYTNLQPMWAKENIQKSDKYSIKEKEEYICRVRPLLILEN